uniref:SET domain-containing protein n=1 Tax=Amphimedon queenslandica TaxID=400682 RepID=A0A1X7TM32_AMPQE
MYKLCFLGNIERESLTSVCKNLESQLASLSSEFLLASLRSLAKAVGLSSMHCCVAMHEYMMARPVRTVSSQATFKSVAEEDLRESKEPLDLVTVEHITANELGVFAKCNIEPKTFITEYKGELLSKEEAARKEDLYKLIKQDKFFLLDIRPNKTLDGMNAIGTIGRQMNHAPKPHCNCMGVIVHERVAIVSERDIAQGDQLTWDYGLRSKDLPWLKTYSSIARAKNEDILLRLHQKSRRRFTQCPLCLSMVESSQSSEHLHRQHHSLTDVDLKYYAAEMLSVKHITKDASQGRKRGGSTRGMEEYAVSEATPPMVKQYIESVVFILIVIKLPIVTIATHRYSAT